VVATTGTGGISAIPVLTKGRGESGAGNLNCNYSMGLSGG
jgi:hypothetical protein